MTGGLTPQPLTSVTQTDQTAQTNYSATRQTASPVSATATGTSAASATQSSQGTLPPAQVAKSGEDIAKEVGDEASQSEKFQKQAKKPIAKKDRAEHLKRVQKTQEALTKQKKSTEQKFLEGAQKLAEDLDGTTGYEILNKHRSRLREKTDKMVSSSPYNGLVPPKGSRERRQLVSELAKEITQYFEGEAGEVNISNRQATIAFFTKHLFPESAPSPKEEEVILDAVKQAKSEFDGKYGADILARHRSVRQNVSKALGGKFNIFEDPKKSRQFLNTISMETSTPMEVVDCMEDIGLIPKGGSDEALKEKRKVFSTIKSLFSEHTGNITKSRQLSNEDKTLMFTVRFFRNFNSVCQVWDNLDKKQSVFMSIFTKTPVSEQQVYTEFRRQIQAR